MKKTLLLLSAISMSLTLMAQKTSPWQVGIFGGPSIPLGNYKKDIGRANNGINAGINVDYYIGQSGFGIGIDARYQRHKVRPFVTDSNAANSMVYVFTNGYSSFTQSDKNAFSHIGISLGPTYRLMSKYVDFNIYAKAGALFQQYPSYEQTLYGFNSFTGSYEKLISPFKTDNASNSPIALMGILGFRAMYNITPNIGIGVQADYLRAFGDNGQFAVTSYEQKSEVKRITFRESGNKDDTYISNIFEYYNDIPVRKSTPIQDVNLNLTLQFKLGAGDGTSSKSTKGGVETMIGVKDQKTGLALGGVKVDIIDSKGKSFSAITDANGTIQTKLKPGEYQVKGSKNNVQTSNASISKQDFQNSNIYKELLHDDNRFTLNGETVDCESQNSVAGITTQLSRVSDGQVLEQLSDQNGKFYYQLDKNTEYNLVAIEDGKFSQTEFVSTKGLDRNKTLYVTLKLGVCQMAEGKEFVVKNILYDFNQSNIRPDAAAVLNNLVQTMKRNPKMTIELSSHTDSRGDNNYNQKLSQARAESAVNYLVSKGIVRNRLQAKGYGENRLKNRCKDGVNCSEAEHEENRRTEIKILKY